MVGNVDVGGIRIPLFGVIYLAGLAVAIIQHFSGLSFGWIGVLAWLVVVFGSIGFVILIIALIFGK